MPHDGWHSHDEEHHSHGPPTRRAVIAAATLLPFGTASAQTADAAQRIADAANRFLALLDDAQRKRVLLAFEADNRLDWHYIPRSRAGLTLDEMQPAQAAAARALFASVLRITCGSCNSTAASNASPLRNKKAAQLSDSLLPILDEKKQSGNARRISIDEIPFAPEGN